MLADDISSKPSLNIIQSLNKNPKNYAAYFNMPGILDAALNNAFS